MFNRHSLPLLLTTTTHSSFDDGDDDKTTIYIYMCHFIKQNAKKIVLLVVIVNGPSENDLRAISMRIILLRSLMTMTKMKWKFQFILD